jgi:hypothetical protein
MNDLIFPAFDYKVKKIEGKPYIFDIIRRKYIFITPEEWVRQHLIHWLIEVHQYPKSLFRIESGLQYNNLTKRTDVVVYQRDGQPFLLIECKAPQIELTQTTLDQALRYNATLKAPFVLISNGLQNFIFKKKEENLMPITEIPFFV